MRGVNGRSLDLRLRLPDQPDGLEAAVRTAVQKAVNRGNITVSLKISRDEMGATGTLNQAVLAQTFTALAAVETEAQTAGVTLGATSAADILAMRGVMDQKGPGDGADALRTALIADIAPLISDFEAMRTGEGESLHGVISGQVDQIAALSEATGKVLDARADQIAAHFRSNIERVLENTDAVNEDRLAQELATLAVKADVTEELDRLRAHIQAARTLLAEDAPKGRKLDFLVQEFNREANTLCSKAQFAELTRIGLDLKHTIDQMREQIQNVE